MAEVCLDCFNKAMGEKHSKRKYIFSENLELCENCGEYKNVIIVERKYYYLNKIKKKINRKK